MTHKCVYLSLVCATCMTARIVLRSPESFEKSFTWFFAWSRRSSCASSPCDLVHGRPFLIMASNMRHIIQQQDVQTRTVPESKCSECGSGARSGVFATLARHADACLASPFRDARPIRGACTQRHWHQTALVPVHQRTNRLYQAAFPALQRPLLPGCRGWRRL
jgi:hypothetical protein